VKGVKRCDAEYQREMKFRLSHQMSYKGNAKEKSGS
jgi:hypothetical protein